MLKYSFRALLLLIIIATSALADSGYIIDKYKVDITIDEKSTYNVKESIDVHFKEKRRGIYRVIPEVFNGKKIKVSDIKTNTSTSIKNEKNYIYLRLGDSQKYIIGPQKYYIQFKQIFGWDRQSKYDEVYYNLIGNDWDTTIKRLEFSITLPKEFDSSKINFTTGVRGSLDNSRVVFSVDGNTIKGYTTSALKEKESVTIALPLKEGYFNHSKEKAFYNLLTLLVCLVYLIVPILSIALWIKYRDKNSVIETVEFYPPDNLTPTEIGYYIDGAIHSKDLTSCIFYWADLGYLKIHEKKSSRFFTKEDFEIEFLKDEITSEKEFEVYLFKALNSYKSSENRVKISSLKNRFYKHIEKSAEILEIDLIMNQKALYSSKSLRMGANIRASIFLIFFITIIFYNYFGVLSKTRFALMVLAGILSVLTTLIMSMKFKSRTEYGREILGKILGFKRFLETAEKNKLETLLDENPSYFYKILPYTIVLGVSKIWEDKFKDLSVESPQWYGGGNSVGNAFILATFMRGFNNSVGALNDNMLSAPKSPSNFGGGGTSIGGGSSGGGAGGGGGGSW
ncbi:DUF2207 domain-containing protein [Cetobacterium sp.]|uniref:DUF2207 domain-containing protein n=1 Tax=Cetobacterium sp. TaxID=2071632 RepID=UPI003F35CE12